MSKIQMFNLNSSAAKSPLNEFETQMNDYRMNTWTQHDFWPLLTTCVCVCVRVQTH